MRSFPIDYGYVIRVRPGDRLAAKSIIAEDPFARPVIAEEDGYLKLTTEEQDKTQDRRSNSDSYSDKDGSVFDLIKADFLTNIKK